MNERTLSVELRTDDGDNMNELFLSQDIRNLNPRLPHDGEAHLVKLTNVSPEGVLSLQISPSNDHGTRFLLVHSEAAPFLEHLDCIE